jgi:hypothetical protein
MLFNRNPVEVGNSMPTPSQDKISETFNLRQVSLENAARYGGSITRDALGLMNFKGDRKNIIVDTKVHFLLPGMCPAIPGWHTDGVPRGKTLLPHDHGEPMPLFQDSGSISEPRYHLLVTGTHCPTKFLNESFSMSAYDNDSNLYENMTHAVNDLVDNHGWTTFDSPDSTVLEWNWWNVHTAQLATARGWRYLIRVTETDYIEPINSPADFIRTQNNVYSPMEFGW